MIFLKYDKWIIYDVGSWKIKNDCPPTIKKEIQKLMEEKNKEMKKGTILD